MKIRLNMWVVLSGVIACLCVGLAVQVHNSQTRSENQLSETKRKTAQAKKQYQIAKSQPVQELPKYSKVNQTFNQFLNTSLNKLNHSETGTPYLKYGTPDAYEALALLFENGEGDKPTVQLERQNITFNEIDSEMVGFGTITFKVTYGTHTVKKTVYVENTATKGGYVNSLKFGDFVPDEGSEQHEKD